jgi:competence protein ComEC
MNIDPLPPRSFLLLSFCVLLLTTLSLSASTQAPSKKEVLRVSFLDVGQGDSILIETPNGVRALIDGGVSPSVTREIGSLLPWNERVIDLVVATHADADHIGGLPEVLEEYDVKATLEPNSSSETAVYAAWQILEREEGAAEMIAEREQVFELDQGVYLTILYPVEGMYGLEGNDASIVSRLSYGDTCFILTGDAALAVEEELVAADGELLDCEVLKAGHHGSRTSTSRAFVDAVSPEYTVISAGRDNRYGHPHEEVVNTLMGSGTEILGTYEHGTITFESDGREVVLATGH